MFFFPFDGKAVNQGNRYQSGENRNGNEICAFLETHHNETGVHLEIKKKHRHKENIYHIPFVNALQYWVFLASDNTKCQLEVFGYRKDECENKNKSKPQNSLCYPKTDVLSQKG